MLVHKSNKKFLFKTTKTKLLKNNEYRTAVNNIFQIAK